MKKIFVFDVDGTFFRESLLLKLVEKLVEFGVFQPWVKKEFQISYLGWMNRQAGYPFFIGEVVRSFKRHVRGVPSQLVEAAAYEAVRECSGMVYAYTRKKIEEARQEGRFLLALSHSPDVVVQAFARKWQLDYACGTVYGVVNGIYTGHASSYGKAKRLREIAVTEGLTLDDSIGMGDTMNDVPLLSAVKHPICFNPPHDLCLVAQKKGWPWVDERKDKAVVHRDGTIIEVIHLDPGS